MCVNISNILKINGYDVILCSTRDGGPLEKTISPGIKFYVLHKMHCFDFPAFTKLLRLVGENGIKVIHAHSSSVFWAIAVKYRLPEVKVIWHDHLGIKIEYRKKIFFYKLISKKIDAIIAVNNDLADWSRRNMKVPQGNVLMINNFPLLNVMERNPNPEYFTIVCLANLRPQKDHGTLIKAIALLVKKRLQKKIKVVLAGSVDHSEYTGKIKSLISELGLRDIIEIRGSVEDTASLLASANCGVLTSVSEGLPIALLEYGMARLPVIVTDVGECAKVVGHGDYGHIVQTGDSEGIANELLWVYNNKDEACRLGQSLRENVMGNYGPNQFINSYQSLLKRISGND